MNTARNKYKLTMYNFKKCTVIRTCYIQCDVIQHLHVCLSCNQALSDFMDVVFHIDFYSALQQYYITYVHGCNRYRNQDTSYNT